MATSAQDPFGQVIFKSNVWRKGADEKREFNYVHFTAFEQSVVVDHMGKLLWQPFVKKVLKDDECSITVFNFSYTKDREGRLKRHKFIYLVWLPEEAPSYKKRRYQLVGERYREIFGTDIHFDWYATNKEELNLNDLTARCRKMA